MRCKPAKLLLILLPGSFCFHTPAIAVRDKISLAGSLAWRVAAGPRRVEMCTGKGTDGEIGAKCVEQIDPRKRESENAVANYNIKVSQMEPSCTCWLPRRLCVCSGLSVAPPVPQSMPIDVVLYMHIKEFGRRSNTGMLAASQVKSNGGSLESVKALVSAHPEHEDELSSLVKSRPPGTVCMLYPSEDALPADEWLKGISAGQVATVVLVDATWDQARRLSKRIPREVARVSLGGGAGNMAGGAQDGRVNTLEALAGFLQEAWGVADSSQVRCAMLSALHEKSRALEMLHGNKGGMRGGVDGAGGRRRRFSNVWRMHHDDSCDGDRGEMDGEKGDS